MARIVITEIMDAQAVARLQARHDVLYDPLLVDDATRLLREMVDADALIVRNRTQVSLAFRQFADTCSLGIASRQPQFLKASSRQACD